MTIVFMLTKFPPILTFRTRCRGLLHNGVEHYLVFGLASPPGRDQPSPLTYTTNSSTDLPKDPPISGDVFPKTKHNFVDRSFKRFTNLLAGLLKDSQISLKVFQNTRPDCLTSNLLAGIPKNTPIL